MTREQRSRNMSAIRSQGNLTTEKRLASALRRHRITGWRRQLPLPGKPDFVFPKERVAVFVDGCFWHGCPKCHRLPDDNRSYWEEKVQKNRARDRRVARELRGCGWRVIRLWEHSLKSGQGQDAAARRIRRFLSGSS